MASITTIGRAKALSLAIEQLVGVEPSMQIATDHVRIYFQPDRLLQVQQRLREMEESGPSDVRIDWFPAFTPMIIRKTLPIAGLVFLAGVITGRVF